MDSNDKVDAYISSAVIEQTTVRTEMTYDALVVAFERELGHWDTTAGDRLLARKALWGEVEEEVAQMAGSRGLMVMTRLDQGATMDLRHGAHEVGGMSEITIGGSKCQQDTRDHGGCIWMD